jgi:hypothetical protein
MRIHRPEGRPYTIPAGSSLRRRSWRRPLRNRAALLGKVPAFAHRGPLDAVVPMLSLWRDALRRPEARIFRRCLARSCKCDCRRRNRESGDCRPQREACSSLHEIPRDWPSCPTLPSRNVFADSGRSAPRM